MDLVLKKVQRYLFIGNESPFVLAIPQPLEVEVGKNILTALLNHADAKAPETPVPSQTTQKATKTTKKDNPKVKQEAENAEQAINSKPETPKDDADAETATEKAVEPVVIAKPLHPLLALIKSTYRNKSLRRTDECLFALAFCARTFATPEERHAVYELVPDLIRTSNDMLSFISHYITLATQSGHAGFGHGLRTAVTRWYEKFTPIELAEMLVRSTSTAGWTHKDVIAKVHPKLKCTEKQSLIDAAMKRTSQLQLKKAPEKKAKRKGKKENVAPAANQEKPSAAVVNHTKSYKRYQTLLEFKSVTNPAKALELVKVHGGRGRFELLPRHLRRSPKIWEAFYPFMSYRELLQAALPMQDFRLLKEGEANAKLYVDMLTKRFDLLEAEHVHPIEIQVIAQLYQHGKRYTTHVKEAIHALYLPEMCPPVKEVQDCLNSALEHSFNHHPKTGVRYYIALDLRCVYDRKKIFHNEVITCFQASVLLAFSIFKREKNVTVVAFTDDVETLAPVNFEPTMTLEQAMKHCVGFMLPTTKVSLAAPLKQAEAQRVKVDVFITITDSLIRVNPSRCPPAAELQEYRNKMKLNLSRYVAISLSRHTPSLDILPGKDPGGLLEMVGYSAHNAKIIEAFAKNFFF